MLGVVPTHEALAMARELGLDLVEVSPTERPPVCRIMDYGKFKYERKKRQKNAAAAHVVQTKEIRLRPKTDSHDREIKVQHARAFLEEGNKVQVSLLFRGRERVHRDMAAQVFNEIVVALGESAKVERPPIMDGKRMTMVLCPTKHQGKPVEAAAKPSKPPRRTEESKGSFIDIPELDDE